MCRYVSVLERNAHFSDLLGKRKYNCEEEKKNSRKRIYTFSSIV
jgi:hypothetical protein